MDRLINNYEKRINTFVLQMAENPIIVKKEKSKYMTTREELFADMSHKILDKKGFIFSTYKTDKERIKDYLEQKVELNKNYKNNKKKNIIEADIFKPTMRFKARTDLERVEETLKETKSLNDKSFALNQINKPITAHSDYSSSSDEERKTQKKFRFIVTNVDNNKNKKKDDFDEEEERKKALHNKVIESRKNMMKKRKFYLTLGLNKRE